MKRYFEPPRESWQEIVRRPVLSIGNDTSTVQKIVDSVRSNGDSAVIEYTKQFDRRILNQLEITVKSRNIDPDLSAAIETAIENVTAFHEQQGYRSYEIDTAPGLRCSRRVVPLRRVGLYVPGGRSPLFSTLIMLAVPAKIAGCEEIIVCSPPPVNEVIEYVAARLGISRLFQIGGAQAIGALAFGTQTVPQVDKILGPGNSFVTSAKQYVSQLGVAIDLPAGPSEVLVVADRSSDPWYVAADLLAQAEHGPDSQVVLVVDEESVLPRVEAALERQAAELPRADIVKSALENSFSVILADETARVDFIDRYAPEHLIVIVRNPAGITEKVRNVGSIFVGPWTPEVLGDYISGTNHTLPTAGYARSHSGVGVESFQRTVTVQTATREGLRYLGPSAARMARAESLDAHARAIEVRLHEQD